ncbi:MAG: F0F1 ATP synthase subunit alpha, partial [Dehalococcoidales bacterium]|nr:F0F1 ATP synthase subunit alpha [Dehalococcoidales bacterium]
RVGSAAQTKAMKQVAGRLRLELAQYRELAAFAQFGTSELDQATRDQLERGRRVTEVLKQGQYSPIPGAQQVMILYAAINGYLDDVDVDQISAFEVNFSRFMDISHHEIIDSIVKTKDIIAETAEALRAAIVEFKQGAKLSA